MPIINDKALRLVKDALDQYETAVESTNCTEKTKRTYILHARNFVRWLNDDFDPGVNVRRRRTFDSRR